MVSNITDFRKKFNKELKTGLLSLLVMMAIDRNPEPSYGYKIIKMLENTSGCRFKFPEGTIYPILSSLSSKGFLKSYWGDSNEGPRRKYYELTPQGRKALKICLEDWKTVSNITEDIIKELGGSNEKK
ncbi:MAG: helix-turn-helix transcriptional regulator [Thermoplasmata archaeon]|nr:MAG: helix-turn-helix transcriptional regulator [Thermoplasmata archaeon]